MKKEQTLPKWFNGQLYKKGDTVRNRFSGESFELNAMELSMYDFVMGAVQLMEMGMFNTPHHAQMVRKGTDWFRKNNATAYMVLLD
jgi:hypothetical protein